MPRHVFVKTVLDWCKDSLAGNVYHSDAHEVFYFDHLTDATFFKLKWFGDLGPNQRNS